MTDLTKAIELAEKASEQLQKSHVKQYTRSDGTVVKEHDDSRQARELSSHASKMSDRAKSSSDITSHKLASDAHSKAVEAHNKAKSNSSDKASFKRHQTAIENHQQMSKYHESEAARIHREGQSPTKKKIRLVPNPDVHKEVDGQMTIVGEQDKSNRIWTNR